MNVRNFFRKIVSRFKESWIDIPTNLSNREIKRLRPLPRPLSMDSFYPNLLDYHTEQHFQKSGFSYRDEYVLLREYGINIKEMEVSRLISFKRMKDEKLNLCESCICDHIDCKFIARSWCLEFTNEKLFKIEIGKLKDRPILYMN